LAANMAAIHPWESTAKAKGDFVERGPSMGSLTGRPQRRLAELRTRGVVEVFIVTR